MAGDRAASNELLAQGDHLLRQSLAEHDPQIAAQAEQTIRLAIDADQSNSQPYLTLATLYFYQLDGSDHFGITSPDIKSRPAWVEALLRQSIKLDPQNATAYRQLGHLYRQTEKNKALAQYQKAYELDNSDMESYYNIGMLLYENGKFDEAEPFFQKILANSDETNFRIVAKEYLGRIYTATGRYELAEANLNEAVTLLDGIEQRQNVNWACPYQALGRLYALQGKAKETAQFFMRAADNEPTDDFIQYDAASHCLDVGDYENALKYIDRALAINAKLSYLLTKANILLSGWYADWREQRDNPPGTPEQEFSAALASYRQGNFVHAERYLRRAKKLPAKERLIVLRGFIQLPRQYFSEARVLFAKAVQINPEDPGAMVGKAHLAIVDKNYRQAEELLQQALDRPLTGGEYEAAVEEMALLGMGWVCSNQNRHAEALDYFEKILALDPDDILALLGKANSLTGLQKLDEAEALLNRVLALQPNNPYAMAELGVLHFSRGNDRKAEEYYRRALEIDPSNYTCPYEGLGLIYLKQGRVEAAKENLEYAIAINPEIEYRKFNALAKIHMQEGNLEEAERLLLQSIKNFPQDNEAAQLLEQVRKMKLGNPATTATTVP